MTWRPPRVPQKFCRLCGDETDLEVCADCTLERANNSQEDEMGNCVYTAGDILHRIQRAADERAVRNQRRIDWVGKVVVLACAATLAVIWLGGGQ